MLTTLRSVTNLKNTNIQIGMTTPIAVADVPEDWLSRPLYMVRFVTLELKP